MEAAATRSPLVEAMSRASFYPDRPDHVELRQTHTSYVFLAGDYAYKIKKPIKLAFIDCSTPALRRELCERELSLNRRLAVNVYCGVVPLICRNGTYRLGGEPAADDVTVDYALKMRRLPDEQRLDHLLTAGRVTLDDIRRIAENLARFHSQVSSAEGWNYGSAGSVWRLVMGNLQETSDLVADTVTQDQLDRVRDYSRRFIATHWEFLNQRARDGRVRDGHGDLRGDSIYLLNRDIAIIDALEFSERLRYGDVAAEIAFLAMDCDRLGQPALAEELSRAYVLAADDADLPTLLPFYKCYRAAVRAKVELIKSRQDECPLDDRVLAREQARRYLELACGYIGETSRNSLLIVCGLAGTGKSTLARTLQQRTEFAVLASDAERKQLAGVAPTARLAASYGRGVYRPEFSAQVYRALIARAEELLKAGQGVILDATFMRRDQRALAGDLARRTGTPLLFVECRAPRAEVVRRLIERNQHAGTISDANVEVYVAQIAEFEPLDEIPPACHVVADTTRDLVSVLAEIERRISVC